jgi:hypothetical protein
MPLQNRVLPTGEIVAHPARGTLTGNRGILHGADRRLGLARWRHPHWIVCDLTDPRGRRRRPMAPGTWTELFFLDEAVALAAGHRPCAYCRRPAYGAFGAAWARAGLPGHGAKAIDAVLHAQRVRRDRRQVTHEAPMSALPDGSFVAGPGAPCLVLGESLLPYGPGGYGPALPRPGGSATVLTPAPTVAVLRAGYRPLLHPTAGAP